MAQFTKYNNPNKRRYRRKPSYTDLSIMAAKEMIIDSKLGYDIDTSYYEDKVKRILAESNHNS